MNKLRMVIPKGSLHEGIVNLLHDVGIKIRVRERGYRPIVNDREIEMKIMRPQNIPKLIEMGSHDVGFTGYDWVVETDADVVEVMDLGLDPVRIIVAIPEGKSMEDLKKKKVVVASEYVNISKKYLDNEGYNYTLLRTYGATEAFPPDDADMIIDNTATGKTLHEHHLKVVDTLMESSTVFIANKKTLKNPWKKDKIEELKMLFKGVLDARERVMLEMNVPKEHFDEIVKNLPCMRSPTVAPLYNEQGYAVKIAVRKDEVPKLIPRLKKLGAVDILEYDIRKVVL